MRLIDTDMTRTEDVAIAANEVMVAVSRDEISLLNSAIGEALEAVEEWEFQTRVGYTTGEARALGTRLRELLRETHLPE